jgi:hypothetical protein
MRELHSFFLNTKPKPMQVRSWQYQIRIYQQEENKGLFDAWFRK